MIKLVFFNGLIGKEKQDGLQVVLYVEEKFTMEDI